MKALRLAIETLLYVCLLALLVVFLWLVASSTGCISMVNIGAGDQKYNKPNITSPSGTNIDSHDVEIDIVP